MPTKQEKAVSRAFLRGKKQGKVREEKHILGFLIAVIVVLLYLLLAQHAGWWPYSRPKLGTAFFTNVSAGTTGPQTASSGTSSSGSTSTSGSSSGSSTSGGTATTSSSGTNPIATFAAGVNVGTTMAQVNSEADGLSQNCALVVSVNASTGGQQEVCTYTEGDKIVTVTYLNNHVISASKSGF